MLPLSIFYFLFVFCPLVHGLSQEIEEEQIRAVNFLRLIDRTYTENYRYLANASWHYHYDRSSENARKMADAKIRIMTEARDVWSEMKEIDWKNLGLPYGIKRQFQKYSLVGMDALSDLKRVKYVKCLADMRKSFVAPKACTNANFTDCHLILNELATMFNTSEDPEALEHMWLEYRRVIGPHYLQMVYRNFVELGNEAAKLNTFSDLGEMWLSHYESIDMSDQIQDLWEDVKPLYVQLHAYIRYKLRQTYGEHVLTEKGPIPVHLIGEIWGMSFKNLWNITVPFPDKGHQDITEELVKQNFMPIHFFQTAEGLYKSLGLPEMPATFWDLSMFEQPKGTHTYCKAYSVDFHDGQDYRVHQCTKIDQEDFLSAHRLMAEVKYFMLCKDQPIIFKSGPINAFQTAIGEAMALTASSEKYLSELGLLPPEGFDNETEINFLFKMALSKVSSLPYDYISDLWRWDVFMRKVTISDYNCKWWRLRHIVQGVEPPSNRTDRDFDLSANYDIISNAPLIQNFISNIVQFQFHFSLCKKAGEFDENDPERPLHKCSIYKSTEAGKYIKKMLEMGASKPWPDAMEAITRYQRKMDSAGMLYYFKPLLKWLEKENQKNGAFVGWEKSKKVCGKFRQEAELSQPTGSRKRRIRDDL